MRGKYLLVIVLFFVVLVGFLAFFMLSKEDKSFTKNNVNLEDRNIREAIRRDGQASILVYLDNEGINFENVNLTREQIRLRQDGVLDEFSPEEFVITYRFVGYEKLLANDIVKEVFMERILTTN